MKSKSFVWVVMGLMTMVLTAPQISSAVQVLVCEGNKPLTAHERRRCDEREREERERARAARERAERERNAREAELARQPHEEELARRRLVGTWYLNGDRNKPCQISLMGSGFEAKNERGEATSLVYVRDHREHPSGFVTIRASNWGDLRGEVRHQSIEWANGTRWTR
jgi:hypothetical protein